MTRHRYEMEESRRGHVWRTEDGELDLFGYEHGHHNGPICENCGYGFCHHCQDLPDEDCPSPQGEPT